MLASKYWLSLAVLALSSQGLMAQLPTAKGFEREFHDHVVEILRAAQISPLPAGDTLVDWATKGPVLYHTIALQPGVVRSSLVRNDAFGGILSTYWGTAGPDSFTVVYRRNDSVIVDLRGQVAGATLRITGSRTEALPIPTTPWAVSDYAMDEHLTPLLLRLPATGASHTVLVLRPYLLRWDTITTTIRAHSTTMDVIIDAGKAHENGLLLSSSGRLLHARRANGSSELRPLELSPLAAAYHAVRDAVPRRL